MNHQCFCRNWAVEKVSWTEYNPGRKFLTCAAGSCSFFKWSEEQMDARAKSTINGLLRKMGQKDDEHLKELVATLRTHRGEMKKAEEASRKWKILCVILLLYIFLGCFKPVEKEPEV